MERGNGMEELKAYVDKINSNELLIFSFQFFMIAMAIVFTYLSKIWFRFISIALFLIIGGLGVVSLWRQIILLKIKKKLKEVLK